MSDLQDALDWVDKGTLGHPHINALADAASLVANIQTVVDEQAEDEGLWFMAMTVSEVYLQQELRRLHAAIEGVPVETPR